MTSTPERQAIITLIKQANADGARLVRAGLCRGRYLSAHLSTLGPSRCRAARQTPQDSILCLINLVFPDRHPFFQKRINPFHRVFFHHVARHGIGSIIIGIGKRHLFLFIEHVFAVANGGWAFA